MNVFDPMQGFNAFAAGAQIGGGIRQAQTNAKLAPMVAAGDYKGAADYAGQRGDLGSAELYRTQYQDQLAKMGEQEKAAAAKRAEDLARTAYGLKNVPYEQRRAALQQQAPMLQQMGIDTQELMQFDPTDQAIDGVLAQVTPLADLLKGPLEINGQLVDPKTYQVLGDFRTPETPDAPDYERWVMGNRTFEGIPGQPDTYRDIGAAPARGPLVQVGGEGQGWKYGPVPAGHGLVTDPNSPTGARMEVIPGSPQALEAETAAAKEEKNLGGTALTVGNLINSYATLAKNKAITAQGNTAADNIAALYSGTGLGQLQDQVGGDVGNLENAEARKNIEGLSMNALMKMISMSDVSAKAMDSDAEMKAWLSAIKSDNYESALTKLYVLDKSFGDGMALQKAYEAGTISLDTYKYVTNRAQNDTYGQQMVDRLMRYKALGESVGESNLTPGERQTAADLQGLLAGDGTPVTEEDIQTTMAKHGMTREEVIARIRGQ